MEGHIPFHWRPIPPPFGAMTPPTSVVERWGRLVGNGGMFGGPKVVVFLGRGVGVAAAAAALLDATSSATTVAPPL